MNNQMNNMNNNMGMNNNMTNQQMNNMNFNMMNQQMNNMNPNMMNQQMNNMNPNMMNQQMNNMNTNTMNNQQNNKFINNNQNQNVEVLNLGDIPSNTQPRNKKEIIQFQNVVKEYRNGEVYTRALNGINLTIYEGEIIIFLGTSGAGKSTALNLLGGLDKATSGRIIVDGDDITKYNENKMLEYRREKIGYIFQFYNLIQTLNAKDNVELVLELCKKKKSNSEYLLEQVGLKERMNNYPSQLSGGEQQRVSIARALAKEPRILFADEPTGALDYNTTRQVLELLVKTCKEKNITLIIVTHNNFITPIADVVYSFRSGEIISIERNQNPTPVGELPW